MLCLSMSQLLALLGPRTEADNAKPAKVKGPKKPKAKKVPTPLLYLTHSLLSQEEKAEEES